MSGAGFEVRAFKADDLNRVMEINFECLPENYSTYFYRELASSYPDTFLVVESEGEIQGYIMCRTERGFSKTRSFSTARLLHVVSIAVREPYRRKGMAHALMHEAMKKGISSYKATECYLEVRVGNDAAIRLYEKLGFTKVKRNYGYYLDGEDAWVMAFPLRSAQDPANR